jgi:hypothetical protein
MKLSERDPLRGLRDTAVSLEDAGVADARGRYISERLAQTIREAPGRHRAAQRQKAMAWGGVAISALGLGLVVAGQLRRAPVASSTPAAQGAGVQLLAQRDTVKGIIQELAGQVDIVNAQGRTTAAVRASALEPSDEVVTRANGRGSMVLPGGARVELSESSRLRLQAAALPAAPQESRLSLLEGKVNVHVPHLDRGSTFTVVTPQAEVIVHGTAFSVEVLKPDGEPAETCVVVSEGVVTARSVDREALLSPGMHWSSRANGSRCATDRMSPEVPSAAARRAESKPPDEPSVAPQTLGASGARHKTKSSALVNSLAAQNRLFEAAMVARKEGDERQAIERFDELLRKYPDSALASEANEQRRRARDHLQKGQPGSDP